MGSITIKKLREYFATAGYHRPGERKLVQKLDFFILSFCCLSYFLAYVSPVQCPTSLHYVCLHGYYFEIL